MGFAVRRIRKHKVLHFCNGGVLPQEPDEDRSAKRIEVRFRTEEKLLGGVGSIGETELAGLIDFPHRLLHLCHALGAVGGEEEEIVGHVLVVSHLERANVFRSRGAPKLLQVEPVEKFPASLLLDDRAHLPPLAGAEERIEVPGLVGVLDEPIDLLEHEVDQHLAALVRENLLDQIEWHAGPTERVDEREGGRDALSLILVEVEEVFTEALLERSPANDTG